MNDQPSVGEFIQASRVLKLTTPLGDDVLLPERASIVEGVNRMFEIEIAVRSKKDIAPADLIGKLVDIEIEVVQGEYDEDPVRRCWNGLVTELHEGPSVTRGLRSYHLVLRPSLWLLSQTRDSRIWMDRSTLDVLDTLLSEHGLNHADHGGAVRPEPAIHYSCQFNESDLRYLLRRFEQAGYFWWFSHQKGTHKLHVANHVSGWLDPSEAAQGDNKVRLTHGSSDRNHITEWKRRFSYVPGTRTGADWNYKTFGQIPMTTTPSLVDLPGNAQREVFEWPARAMDTEESEQAEKVRMQATEADHERVSGASTVRILEPGRRFTPYDVANRDSRFEEHVIVAAEHHIVDRSYETDGGSLPEYRNRFEAIPSRIPLTPHRTTPRPKVEGLQVAVVAGPAGEEIHCDSEGCIKLWFPWQRHRAKKDGTDTKWIRVATNWAGQGWGGQVIPRIGMEVLVAFLDSDPDRPLVTGVVPNPTNYVPYPLPANKTKSAFRTNTHKSKNKNMFNEIRFDDLENREEVRLTAQKDMNAIVNNNDSKIVKHNSAESVLNNRLSETFGDSVVSVYGAHTIFTGPSGLNALSYNGVGMMANKLSEAAYALDTTLLNVGMPGDFTVHSDGNHNVNVKISKKLHIGQDYDISIHGNQTTRAQGNISYRANKSHSSSVGEYKTTSVGKKYTLFCGKSRIEMDSEGNITISGVTVNIIGSKKIDLNP